MLFNFSCSTTYFFIYSLGIILQLLCAVLVSYILVIQADSKEHDAFENISSGNINFSASTCFYLCVLGVGIGLGSILFGLGGGSVMNPLFIMLGFDPLVTNIFKL